MNKQRCTGAILGHIVADALGVPVEFKDRLWLKEHPVTDMTGYGTHSQPAGTWSDDSSMTIATVEWLGERQDEALDYHALMDKFSAWLLEGAYTPYGVNFDNGIATAKALTNYGRGVAPLECGCKGDYDNGNGSLMRILPVALYYASTLHPAITLEGVQKIFDMSALTHAHLRSKVGCLIYAKVLARLLDCPNVDKVAGLQQALTECKKYLEKQSDGAFGHEVEQYSRLWNLETFKSLAEEEIKSSGYVLHTLEAGLWCFLNTDNYRDCVLKAVNLGDDTDTVGAVAGGLAGLYYGLTKIPTEWLELIPKREWIMDLVENMIKSKQN